MDNFRSKSALVFVFLAAIPKGNLPHNKSCPPERSEGPAFVFAFLVTNPEEDPLSLSLLSLPLFFLLSFPKGIHA